MHIQMQSAQPHTFYMFWLSSGSLFHDYSFSASSGNPSWSFLERWFCWEDLLIARQLLHSLLRSLRSFLSGAFCTVLAEGNIQGCSFLPELVVVFSGWAGKDNSGVNHFAPPMEELPWRMIKGGEKKSESERECVCAQIEVGKVGVVSMSRQATESSAQQGFSTGSWFFVLCSVHWFVYQDYSLAK